MSTAPDAEGPPRAARAGAAVRAEGLARRVVEFVSRSVVGPAKLRLVAGGRNSLWLVPEQGAGWPPVDRLGLVLDRLGEEIPEARWDRLEWSVDDNRLYCRFKYLTAPEPRAPDLGRAVVRPPPPRLTDPLSWETFNLRPADVAALRELASRLRYLDEDESPLDLDIQASKAPDGHIDLAVTGYETVRLQASRAFLDRARKFVEPVGAAVTLGWARQGSVVLAYMPAV